MGLIKLFLQSFKKNPKGFGVTLILLPLLGVIQGSSVFSLAPIIDIFRSPDLSNASSTTIKLHGYISDLGIEPSLTVFVSVFIFLTFLKNGLGLLTQFILFKVRFRLTKDLIRESFSHFFKAKWSFFTSTSQGLLLNTFNGELNNVANGFNAIFRLYRDLILLTCLVVVLFSISWELTLIGLVLGGLVYLPGFLSERWSYKFGLETRDTMNALQILIQESIDAAKIMLGYHRQKKFDEALEEKYEVHAVANIRNQMMSTWIASSYEPFLTAFVFFLMYISMTMLGKTLSESLMFLYTVKLCNPLLTGLVLHKNHIKSVLPSYEQWNEINEKAKMAKQPSGSHPFPELKIGVELKDLSFEYQAGVPVLRNLNLSFPKGKMLALVGKSGSGKSTLIDILMGFYEPLDGSIEVDGYNLNELNLSDYRSRIGYVPQEPYLFHLSIRDNITWGVDKFSEEQVEEAARLAGAHEFITKLSEGYETMVGDRGVKLSGGQRQRISLARAIIRNPDILILDEATSALDSESEKLIQASIEQLSKKMTIIAVAHRLSTIQASDIIYVMDEGRLIESGNYGELMKKEASFYELAKLQGMH